MHQKYITRWRSDNIFLIHNAAIPSQSTSTNSCRSQTIFVQSFFVLHPIIIPLLRPPCISGASGKPRGRVPQPRIKYGENLMDKKKDSSVRAACEYPLDLTRLKKFVQVSEGTGFCVDTENAAVWASASSAFSVSFLAKFCTPWYLRSSELRQIQRRLYTFPFLEFICFKFPSPGILYPIFLLGNTVIRALPAADVPSSFGSL